MKKKHVVDKQSTFALFIVAFAKKELAKAGNAKAQQKAETKRAMLLQERM